jgi:hypothetical protein
MISTWCAEQTARSVPSGENPIPLFGPKVIRSMTSAHSTPAMPDIMDYDHRHHDHRPAIIHWMTRWPPSPCTTKYKLAPRATMAVVTREPRLGANTAAAHQTQAPPHVFFEIPR